MGSMKPSMRSKANHPPNHPPLANGTAPHLEAGVLTEQLRAFKTEKFDADNYVEARCQTMSEKGIRNLCSELVRLKKASAEEMRRSVYANYAAFIRTSQEISDLEGELLAMRNLLANQAALIHGLADGVRLESLPNGPEATLEGGYYIDEDSQAVSEDEKYMHDLLDFLDVLIAERRVDEALINLFEGEKIFGDSNDREHVGSAFMARFQEPLSERRARLAEQLVEAARQPSTRGAELRAAISALYRLGDGPRAHTMLLSAHSQKLQHNVQGLRSSGTSYGGTYTTALSQLVFSAISQAAKDSQSVFGEQAAYASELVLWASNETINFASLVKRHVLLSAAAAGGLRAAAECVQIALGYCSLLEAQGLALCPTLLKFFRPSVEEALQATLKHIEEGVAVLAAADDWEVHHPASAGRSGSRANASSGSMTQARLSSSAQRFQALIQDFFDDVVPLIHMQLGSPMLDGLVHLFESYVLLLMKAMPGAEDDSWGSQIENRIVKPAETDHQQLGLLANASALAEEILPRAAMKLFPPQLSNGRDEPRKRANDRTSPASSRMPELREWRRRLQRMVDKLRDHYCRQQVLDLIYTDDGGANLTVEWYLSLENEVDMVEPMPSPIFQELFFKLNKLSHVAADVLAGRERMTGMLLMRLVETFVLWLAEDQDFWEGMEESLNPLGQIGLQQFVLDMQFVIQIASHGRYLSRHIRTVVADIITRSVEAFSRTGLDPDSVLPENEWFLGMAQDSMQKLLTDWSRGITPGSISSPPASLSAQSVSSTRSHGST